ncbi:CheY-like protein [Neoconidiobolus thromboides FSU 785]|nr:CheY-like protein [Neoconidiobolus thromboides FSU 785]
MPCPMNQFTDNSLLIDCEEDKLEIEKMEKIKILIVDDNIIYQKLLKRTLTKYYSITNIVTVENGVQALQLLQRQSFDLVFMDIDMPIMNGIECTKVIRNLFDKELLIIAVSTNYTNKDILNYCDSGMNGYIRKPFHPAAFRRFLVLPQTQL